MNHTTNKLRIIPSQLSQFYKHLRYPYSFILFVLLLILATNCKKAKLAGDRSYNESLITAQQHIQAVAYTTNSWPEAKAQVKSTDIVFSFHSGKMLADSSLK